MTVLIGVVAVFLLLAAACDGNGEETPTPTPRVATVSVELGEFSVTLDRSTVSAGEVTFNVTNAGGLEHEFVVLKTDLAHDELPVVSATGFVEEAILATAIGKIEDDDLGRGKSVSITVDLERGNYVLLCNNLPAHYSSGMSVRFRVN